MSKVDRLQIVVNRAAITSPPNQDVMSMSIHFARRTSVEGSTSTGLDNTIRALVEARWDTFWGVVKPFVQSFCVNSDLRWYEAFPSGEPPHAPVRTSSRSVAGTAGAAAGMPPQCAVNCTLETVSRRHWGRFALGGFAATANLDSQGLLVAGTRGAIATGLAAFLNGCLTDGAAPVVYNRTNHTYRPVISCRIDDVIDIIRRRRYEHTTTRTINALTVPAASPSLYIGPLTDTQ